MISKEDVLGNLLNLNINQRLSKLENSESAQVIDLNYFRDWEKTSNGFISLAEDKIRKIIEEAELKKAKEEEAKLAKSASKTPLKNGGGKTPSKTPAKDSTRGKTPGTKSSTAATSKTPVKAKPLTGSQSVKKIEVGKPTNKGTKESASTKASGIYYINNL